MPAVQFIQEEHCQSSPVGVRVTVEAGGDDSADRATGQDPGQDEERRKHARWKWWHSLGLCQPGIGGVTH